MINFKKFLYISTLLLLQIIFTTGCNETSATTPQEEFPADKDYFLGLQYLQKGQENEAILKFKNCFNSGSTYCAKRSIECLATLGSVQDRNNTCELMIQRFPETETKIIAAKQFYSADEINKVISLTEDINIKEDNNELIKLRFQSFIKRADKDISKDILYWFISRPLTKEHLSFIEESFPFPENEDDYNRIQKVIAFRIDLYNRDYSPAINKSDYIINLLAKADLEPTGQIASDLGKAFLYGSEDFKKNASKFANLANLYKQSEAEFYFWFYSGRLYAKAETYKTQSLNSFENAIHSTKDAKQKDNALWYLLNAKIDLSFSDTIKNIGIYAKQWSDPEYFDDFFDTLIPTLLVSDNWDLFPILIEQIDGYASDEIVSRISYIFARLVQLNKIPMPKKDEVTLYYFERALACGTNYYYRMMALYQLGATYKDFSNFMTQFANKETIVVDKDAERLLLGYIRFGFPEKIYTEWLNFYNKGISTDVSMQLASFLAKCGAQKHEYYPQSVRIASRAANITDRPLTKNELQLVYPQFYKNYINNNSKKYELDNSTMYALIRSESFFDSEVVSHAGAVGLSQLMEMTGEDIARKLKKKDYSLTDPDTNIEFGTFYLAELIKRCDNNRLHAFFSYNAGITRVRRWLESSMVHYGTKSKMSDDLFLETVPYSETREYGRKLISASVFYEFAYSDSQNYKQFFSFLRGL